MNNQTKVLATRFLRTLGGGSQLSKLRAKQPNRHLYVTFHRYASRKYCNKLTFDKTIFQDAEVNTELSVTETSQALKKVAIVGVTGYAGQELLRLLLQHERVVVQDVLSRSEAGKRLDSVYPGFQKYTDLVCTPADVDLNLLAEKVDVIFLALPHGHAAARITSAILEKCLVIDLSADFRLKNLTDYDQWYAFQHQHPELLARAVYGLPELFREQISKARLIANPGCFATASILALAPLLKAKLIEPSSIIIDAKSGVSGAGRAAALDSHFNECNESIKAYKVGTHRHTPEIEQALQSLTETPFYASFTPHLIPMNRGILVTTYASLVRKISQLDLFEIYNSFYDAEPFVRVYAHNERVYKLPETRFVKGSNFFDVGMQLDPRTNRVVVVGALDNLIKGASGQAIQNMNVAFDFPEMTGITQMPVFPG